MGDRNVTIVGFPVHLPTLKLRLFVETYAGSGSVESVTRNEEVVVVTFKDCTGLTKFRDANVCQYKTHDLKVTINRPASASEPDSKPPPTASAERDPIKPVDQQMQEILFKNMHYWNSMSSFPAPAGTRCVLAQGIDSKASFQKVKMHFESRKRSNGGPVACLVNMIDGLLVVFQNGSDCEGCLSKLDQSLDNTRIKVFPKLIPSRYERTFVVEGVGDQTNLETLEMFLESCSSNESTPSQCEKLDFAGMYLVSYGSDVELSEVPFIKQNMISKPLEGHQLQARLLLKTDCLKLSNVGNAITNDQIKLTLESKKRSDGGPVTRVDRTEHQNVLVYFALIADAERVYEKAKQSNGEIIVNQHPIRVRLYYHCLANDHESVIGDAQLQKSSDGAPENEIKPLEPFQLQPNCSQKLLKFINDSEKQQKLIKGYFKRFATIDFKFLEDESVYVLNFVSRKVSLERSTMTQEVFENKCTKNFEDLVKNNYAVERRTFDPSKLARARSVGKCKLNCIEESYSNNQSKDFVVCWEPGQPEVEVIGLKQPVEKAVKEIETAVANDIVTEEFPSGVFKIILHCGVLDEITKSHPRLEISKDENNCIVTFCGPIMEIMAAKAEAYAASSKLERKKLTGIDESIFAWLAEKIKTSDVITEKLQAILNSADVKATIEFDEDRPFVRVKSSEDYERAVQAVKRNINVKVAKLDAAKSEALKLPEWNDFQSTLQNTDQFGIHVKDNEEIAIVGFKTEVEDVRRKIEEYLHENGTQTFFLGTVYGKAKFIIEQCQEFSSYACKIKKITCQMTPDKGGGVYLKGKRSDLHKAHQQLVLVEKNVIEFPLALTNPGIEEFYSSEDGKTYLLGVQRAHGCVVLIGSPECEEWKEAQENIPKALPKTSLSSNNDSQRMQGRCLSEVTLAGMDVKLSVWKTNITEHKCDAIVNASNEELMLLPSGISGAIKKFDDKNLGRIQDEMKAIIARNYGSVDPGSSYMTSAGNLPNCKKIVHAVGPRWSHGRYKNPGLVLKSCINQVLKAVNRVGLKSVAIPAVSCGVFGGKISVCIPLIVEAVEEFFSEGVKRSIKEVHFIERSLQDVLDEFVSTLDAYKGASAALLPSAATTDSQRMHVNIVQGDIVMQQADVIVNPTDPKNIVNMAKGPMIGQLLAKKAGGSVVQQCANMQGPFNVGTVHETSAGGLSCKKIYHAVVTHYDPQSSTSVLESAISECLKKAESAGYSSIVFPAIATGGYRHPANFVAKTMKRVIRNFPTNNLKNISILLYPGNQPVIDAFTSEFDKKDDGETETCEAETYEAGIESYAFVDHEEHVPENQAQFKSSFIKIDDYTGSVGRLTMSICEGDITEMGGDVIVNSTNQGFKLDQGLVSTKILQVGGSQLQDEANKKAKPKADFIVTSAGNLPCKKVVHLVTPDNPEDLHRKIVKVLDEMEKLKMKSVYMPAFGTGMLALEVDTIASIMRASIEEFATKHKRLKHLEFVSIVIFNRHLMPKFQQGFFHPEKKKGMLERLVTGFKNLFYSYAPSTFPATNSAHAQHQEQLDKDAFHLFLYAPSEETINKAVKEIKKDADRRTLKRTIEDPIIERLTDWERYEIQEIIKRCKVRLSRKKDKYLGTQLIFEGATKDVMKAHDQAKDVIREFAAAETRATYAVWQEKSKSGDWKDLSPRSSSDLEEAYKNWSENQKSVSSHVKIRCFRAGEVMMQDYDLSDTTSHDGRIRRRILERNASDLPITWGDMNDKLLFLTDLPASSQEYKDVLQKFTSGNQIFHTNIVSIKRIQNVQLYKQYTAKKREISHKLQGFQKPIEHQLFHGTGDDDKIIRHGFDRSYAGKNATAYGRGVYFAVNPAYSHRYSPPNQAGEKRMFLSDVITGEFCVGNQNVLAPPPKPTSSIANDIYDSVVDNLANPQIFVIFKDASAYPTYLITYT